MEDGRRFGMDPQSLANLRATLDAPAPLAADEFGFDGVWPENVPIVEAFLTVSLQWRVVPRSAGGFVGMGGGMLAPIVPFFIGLDYSAVRAGLDAEGIVVTPELWRGLRVMEAEACAALNEDNG